MEVNDRPCMVLVATCPVGPPDIVQLPQPPNICKILPCNPDDKYVLAIFASFNLLQSKF